MSEDVLRVELIERAVLNLTFDGADSCFALWVNLSALPGSLLGLFLFLLLDGSGPLCELLADLLSRGNRSLHPGMANAVSQRKTSVRVQLEHISDQVLELVTEEAGGLALGVLVPEQVSLALSKQLVVGVFHRVRRVEWWVAGVQDEEDDGDGEEVH